MKIHRVGFRIHSFGWVRGGDFDATCHLQGNCEGRGQLLSKTRVEAMVSTPFSVAPAAWRSSGKRSGSLTRASALYPSTPCIPKPSSLDGCTLTPCACRVVCRTMGNASLDALFIGQVRARVVGHPDHQGKRAIAGRGGPVCPRHLGALGCPDGPQINVFCEKPRRYASLAPWPEAVRPF